METRPVEPPSPGFWVDNLQDLYGRGIGLRALASLQVGVVIPDLRTT